MLTKAEVRALRLAAYGLTTREAAAAAHVAVDTMKGYRKRAMRKLDARNMTHAVAIAYETGVFTWEAVAA